MSDKHKMSLSNQYCSIQIGVDNSYIVGANSNQNYDLILNPDNYGLGDCYKVFCIKVDLNNRAYNIALIGDYQSFVENCAILEDTILTVLHGWMIVQLDILTGKMIRIVTLDTIGCNFGIFKAHENYLIYGETDITMLDVSFQKLWSFSGRDIFISITQKTAFELKPNLICLYDFEDNYYELDYDGNLLTDIRK